MKSTYYILLVLVTYIYTSCIVHDVNVMVSIVDINIKLRAEEALPLLTHAISFVVNDGWAFAPLRLFFYESFFDVISIGDV